MWADGFSRQPCSRVLLRKDLSVMVTPILPTSLHLSTEPRCESLKRGRLIGLCARPTELDSVRWRSLGRYRAQHDLPQFLRHQMALIRQTAPGTTNLGFEINFAFLSANTTSIRIS